MKETLSKIGKKPKEDESIASDLEDGTGLQDPFLEEEK
jgi:hypothetical protein